MKKLKSDNGSNFMDYSTAGNQSSSISPVSSSSSSCPDVVLICSLGFFRDQHFCAYLLMRGGVEVWVSEENRGSESSNPELFSLL